MLIAIALAALIGDHAANAADGRGGVFPDVDRMEAELKKGVSTKADVEALLGRPIGRGGALSGLEPGRPRDIWVYGEFGWSVIGFKEGVARLHYDQRLLMVYFVDGVFDGFWWHSNAAVMTEWQGN